MNDQTNNGGGGDATAGGSDGRVKVAV